MSRLELEALESLPEIHPGDDLAQLLEAQLHRQLGGRTQAGVLVVAQKVVSKAEGRIVSLAEVSPGRRAFELAAEVDKDPRLVELILSESRRIVRRAPGVLICETHHGLTCANAGIDQSNAPDLETVILLPRDPDRSAARICERLAPGCAVIISDTFGRPWREGLVDVAIGVAGMHPLRSEIGETDRSGRELRVTVLALADQLTAAAGMLMTKKSGRPAVWITGTELKPGGEGRLRDLLRAPERDLFR